jgi:hypothetical protein
MQQEELKRQKLDKLIQLLLEIPKSNVQSVAVFIENKMRMLKACYDKSEPHHKAKIHELITYTQLRCFLTGEKYTNTRDSKYIELKDVIYSVESIKGHIKKKQLPKESSWKAIDIYSFYFGGYRAFFRCFGKVYLEKKMELDKDFIEDVFSTKERDLYVSEERLEIDGIKIIDKSFIEKVKTGKHFTEPEFYGATQNNDCQFYGIINEYDIVRKGYDDLKKVIIDSFIKEKDEKVTAIICGSGGSGKSTVLRRTAFDLHNEPIHIVWIEDDNIEAFVEKGFSAIKNEVDKNESQKFLIIIEDWYRIFKDNKKQVGTDILKKAKNINNIRIIIGDRTIDESYKNHRNNNFELHLSSDDNKEIIEKIVEKYPDWKPAWEKLLKENKDYKSSLFLLLFILARINQKEFKNETMDLAEPQQVFQRIIESDLRFIANQEEESYKGLAKTIYYWACIYTEHKTSISYETFLKIADHYNEKNTTEICDLFSRWNVDDEIMDRLKLYINVNEEELLEFNHDILAEGLNKINIEGWKKYGTKIKLNLLDVIIEKGDDYSASVFLGRLLFREEQMFKNLKEKLSFIKALTLKNNRYRHHLDGLFFLKYDTLNDEDINAFMDLAKLFWEKKNYNTSLWHPYLHYVKGDQIISNHLSEILKKESLAHYTPDFINCILRNTKNEDLDKRNEFIKEVLQYKNIEKIDRSIISASLQFASKDVSQKFSNEVIGTWKKDDDSYFVLNCLDYAENEVIENFCKNILSDVKWSGRDNLKVVIGCLDCVDDETKQNYINKIILNGQMLYILNFYLAFSRSRKLNMKELLINNVIKNIKGDFSDDAKFKLFLQEIFALEIKRLEEKIALKNK